MMRRALEVVVVLCAVAGCRPDPGLPDYSKMQALLDGGSGPQGALPGPFPYVPGTRRLAFGIFYEGGASQTLAVDDASRHYYVFGDTGPTYGQQASNDRVEGLRSDELNFVGNPWWGGGIIWDIPTDLSKWATLRVSLASPDPGLSKIELRLVHGEGTATQEAVLEAGDYGWANDGRWHTLTIPLADFVAKGGNLAKVRGPFVIGGLGPKGGEKLLVDDVYME